LHSWHARTSAPITARESVIALGGSLSSAEGRVLSAGLSVPKS
jgi:hypothetical protein